MRLTGGFPPSDVVERMVLCYHAPYLAYEHLRDTSCLLPYILPELEQREVLETVVQAYLSLKRSILSVERLLELVKGGRIPADQQKEFDLLVSALQEFVRPCLELEVYWKGEQKKAAAPKGRPERPLH